MAEWTQVTGTLTGWNEENATEADLLAAVQEVLPTDVCPTWCNRDTIKVRNASTRLFSTGYYYWNFCLPTVKTSEVPESESLSVHLVSYVRDNAVFIGTDVDASVLDEHKPYNIAPDRHNTDSWNTLHTSHCITYAEGFKSDAVNWLTTSLSTKLCDNVGSFYNFRIHGLDPRDTRDYQLYSPPCKWNGEYGYIYPFMPRYFAISYAYSYHSYGPYTYRSVETPDTVYTQTHGCFFLLGDAEDYATQTESAQG